jgi:hypothetical protein
MPSLSSMVASALHFVVHILVGEFRREVVSCLRRKIHSQLYEYIIIYTVGVSSTFVVFWPCLPYMISLDL